MCQVCEYIIFRIQQEFDRAKSQLERDKVETLGSLLADAHIAKWQQKEGLVEKPTIDEAPDQALGVIVAGPGAGKSLTEKHEAEKEVERDEEEEAPSGASLCLDRDYMLAREGDEPYEPDYWGAHYE